MSAESKVSGRWVPIQTGEHMVYWNYPDFDYSPKTRVASLLDRSEHVCLVETPMNRLRQQGVQQMWMDGVLVDEFKNHFDLMSNLEGPTVRQPAETEVLRQKLAKALLRAYGEYEAHPDAATVAENKKLRERLRFLEAQLQSDRPYLHLYKIGAGGLFASVISIAIWVFTKIGAPLHPVFAAFAIPASIGAMAMAFLVRRGERSVGTDGAGRRP